MTDIICVTDKHIAKNLSAFIMSYKQCDPGCTASLGNCQNSLVFFPEIFFLSHKVLK